MGYNRVLGHFTNSQELAVPWQGPGQLYLTNQIVINSNLLYLSTGDFVSTASFAADLAAGRWIGINNGAITTIAQGGTGQTTQTAAFDALSPTTTAGDLIVYNGTDNVRQAVGSDGQVLIADSSQPNKLKWATAPSGNTNFITNGSAESNNTTGWATYAETDAVTFTDAGDLVSTASAHGLSNGNQISFTAIVSTTGISTNTLYYVISATSTTFQVSSTLNGAALPLTTNGTGTMVRFAPKTGSGGSPSVTIASDPTNPLIGSYSFLLAKGAPNREGQGWSYDFTIDRGYQAKVLQISFQYLVNTGTFVAGSSSTVSDVTVYIYDVTNAQIIQPSSFKLLSNSATVSDTFNATFQTASNSTSYRLIFHVSTPSTADYTLKVDGITVSPSTYVYGTPITDWQTYTPTTAGLGTISAVNMYWRRVGSNAEVMGNLTTGTVTGVEAQIGLPAGLTSTSTISTIQQAGTVVLGTSTSSYRNLLIETSKTYLTVGVAAATSQLAKALGTTFANTVVLSFQASVPIQGFSSSVQTSDQTDTRVVAMSAQGVGGAVTANVTNIPTTTTYLDTHGSWTGSTYVVPVSGNYQIFGGVSGPTNTSLAAYVDGVASIGVKVANGTNANGTIAGLLTNLKAGSVVSFRADVSQTLTYFLISMSRVSGPSAIAASESVNAYYTSSSTASIPTSSTLFTYATKVFDTHSAYNSGVYTAPISGKYQITAQYSSSSSTICSNYITIVKNGSTTWADGATVRLATVASLLYSQITSIVNLNAGETIQININSSQAGQTFTGISTGMFFGITRVGN